MADLTDQPIVVGLGELLWDCFRDSKAPGGAPANVAFHAQQLGCRGAVCSRVGADSLGDELLAFLRRQGLTTEFVQLDAEHATGTVSVDDSRPNDPQYTIHENVAWDHLARAPELESICSQASAVCFGTLAQRSPTSRRTIRRAVAATPAECLRVYDVNLRQHYFDRSTVETSLAKATLVKLNADEVLVLGKLLGLPSESLLDFARAVRRTYAVDAVCVTRGKDGCLMASGESVADVPGEPVEVADAVGAGDAFTAAWIVARLRKWPLAQQARFANRVGGLVASHPGAMPSLREPLAEIQTSFGES